MQMGARRLAVTMLTGVLAAGLGAGSGARGAAASTPVDASATIPGARQAGFEAMRVMPLGDSITLGTGGPTRDSYRSDLATRLLRDGLEIDYVGSQSNGTGTDTQHEGHGGSSIDELSPKLDGWLAQSRPDVVLVHAGTNNITQGDGPYATVRMLSAMIDQIRAARPATYIFVAQIVSSRVPRELAADRVYNRLIPTMVAAKNDPLITVVDQSTVGGIDLHDLHHPNDFGYSKMAYNFYRAMAQVFKTSGDTGDSPYQARSSYRCMAFKTVTDGKERHRTECRIWKLRTTTIEVNGVKGRVCVWQTLRTVNQTYYVRVGGRFQPRTRLVKKWTGPGNLLNV
jgi:lysophospholipase L1-like esterase